MITQALYNIYEKYREWPTPFSLASLLGARASTSIHLLTPSAGLRLAASTRSCRAHGRLSKLQLDCDELMQVLVRAGKLTANVSFEPGISVPAGAVPASCALDRRMARWERISGKIGHGLEYELGWTDSGEEAAGLACRGRSRL